MGLAQFESEVPFDQQVIPIATVLARTPHGNLHAGLLYRGADGNRLALHLGWKDSLGDTWDFPVVWATPDADPELLTIAAGYCRRIWARFQETGTFHYSLQDDGADFDQTGQLVLAGKAHGLTCATIILAVFRAAGINLVRRETWPVRKDLDLRFLANVQRFAEPEHFKLLQAEVAEGVQRVHPDEAVAACACPLPASFDVVRPAADVLVERLDARYSA